MKWINWVIFLLRFVINLIPVLIFALYFYLKAYLQCPEPFSKVPDESHVTFLFLGNNRQHRPVCAKIISSWVKKVLYIAKAHVLGSVWEAATSAAKAAGVSLVSILQMVTGQEFLHQLDTIFHLYHYYRFALGFCAVFCAGPQWVGTFLGSVKH